MMGGWLEFVAALAIFIVAHLLPVRPTVRRRLVGLISERRFTAGYSAISLGLLAWLIVAAGRAPYVELWPFEPWQLWVPNAVMPFVCLLLALSIGAPNPLSFGSARNEAFDPAQPGIVGFVRHPILWSLTLWSLAHLVPNGNLAHTILFGLFACMALLGMQIIDNRKKRQLGDAEWSRLAGSTSNWPLTAITTGRWRMATTLPWRRLAAALALYLALAFSHQAIIGVAPWPR